MNFRTPSSQWPLPLWAVLGLAVGGCIAMVWNPLPLFPLEIVAQAYTIPKIPNGTGLHMAMVHDVIHERYLRHGPAWDQKRAADALAVIALSDSAKDKPLAWFDATDDRAVSLDRLGDHFDAIALMRRKLEALPADLLARTFDDAAAAQRRDTGDPLQNLQRMVNAQSAPPMAHHVYTTYANLGTFLVHAYSQGMVSGDPVARAFVEEGLADINKSIQLNSAAHFGRETWQALAIHQMLYYAQKPNALGAWDLAGQATSAVQRINWPLFRSSSMTEIASLQDRLDRRSRIGRIMPEQDWLDAMALDIDSVYFKEPFDEPTLAIIGMWTLGGGPNAHFALTLGRIMESVGQNQIAWNAYQRAIELKASYWPDPAKQQLLVEICRNRQTAIGEKETSSPAQYTAWSETMLQTHQKELAWGLQYQQDYQAFEAAQIARGIPLNDSHFYDAFFKGRPSIASDPGLSDMIRITHRQAITFSDFLPASVLSMSLFVAVGVLLRKKGPGRQEPFSGKRKIF